MARLNVLTIMCHISECSAQTEGALGTVKKECAVSRSILSIFLLAVVVCGMTAAFPGMTGAQGPMIAQEAGALPPVLFLALDPDALPTLGNPDALPAHVNPDSPATGGQGPQLGTGADDPSDWVAVPPDQEGLYREVRELRNIVDRLRKEADARDQLRGTTEEERDKEAEILEAAGREYSLRPVWVFDMDLNVAYSYNSYDIIRKIDMEEGNNLEYHSNHTLTNSFSLGSGVRDNLSLGATVPFVYKYDKVDTASSMDKTNLGDISLNLQYQPLKTGRGYPAPIFSFGYTLPTGEGIFDINPQTELATGSGLYTYSAGVSVSQPFDPVNAFASISYAKSLKKTRINQVRPGAPGLLDAVNPGASISGSLGFGYAVSYRTSLTLSLSYGYMFSTDYYWLQERNDGSELMDTVETSSGDDVSASLNIGTAWRISPGRTVIVTIGKGLTTANPGFSLSVRLPVSFDRR